MWIIIHYSKAKVTMYEFETEREARETYENIQGSNKVLSEIIYFNDNNLSKAIV